MGDASFGVLRTSPEHQPHFPPTEIVVKLWPLVLEVMAAPLPGGLEEPLLSEAHWPVVLSIVANQYVAMTNATLDTEIGLRLLMEAAVIGAKLDPELVEPGKWSFEAAEGRLSVARRPG